MWVQSEQSCRDMSLRDRCLLSVREHFPSLGAEAVLGLPVPVIKDLLPHLRISQLVEVQPALNRRGISTLRGWTGVQQDIFGRTHVVEDQTEDQARRAVMTFLFPLVFYGFRNHYTPRNISDLEATPILMDAVKTVPDFLVCGRTWRGLQRLVCERRPLLDLMEKHVRTVRVTRCEKLSKETTQLVLYVLHRLLDHGAATALVVDFRCPLLLDWLLQRRGLQPGDLVLDSRGPPRDGPSWSPEDPADLDVPRKRLKTDSRCGGEGEGEGEGGGGGPDFSVDLPVLCRTFAPSPPAGLCSRGRIERLEVRNGSPDSFEFLVSALPTFYSLRSLTLHNPAIFQESILLQLSVVLKQLSASGRCLLSHLHVSHLPCIRILQVLLDAVPRLRSLHADVWSMLNVLADPPDHEDHEDHESDRPELPLEKLEVRFHQLEAQRNLGFLLSWLGRSPHLVSLHVSEMRLPARSSQSSLLSTLSGRNRRLKNLHLHDVKLSDCFPDILNLLKSCELEELRLSDCRLLEDCPDKDGRLRQLVEVLKTLPSLHTLGLAKNRIAKSVCVLAELFSEPSPSSVKRLDISSNFIQPAELLQFAERLAALAPPQRLVLDLRMNPGDRDPDTWTAALRRLDPLAVLLLNGWRSTDTMVDHVSNM